MMAAAVQTDKFLINSLVLSCLALAHRFPPARWKIFGQCERHRNNRVAKSDLNSTDAYFATKNSTKNGIKLPKIAQKLPKIAQIGPKMTQNCRNGPKMTQNGPKISTS